MGDKGSSDESGGEEFQLLMHKSASGSMGYVGSHLHNTVYNNVEAIAYWLLQRTGEEGRSQVWKVRDKELCVERKSERGGQCMSLRNLFIITYASTQGWGSNALVAGTLAF